MPEAKHLRPRAHSRAHYHFFVRAGRVKAGWVRVDHLEVLINPALVFTLAWVVFPLGCIHMFMFGVVSMIMTFTMFSLHCS